MAKATKALNGATLRQVREQFGEGVSLAELSRRLGRNRGWAQKVESLNLNLDLNDAIAICDVLGCSIAEFGVDESDAAPKVFRRDLLEPAALRKRGITSIPKLVEALANKASLATVYNWKNRGVQPSPHHVARFAEVMGLQEEDCYVSVKATKATKPTQASPAPASVVVNGDPVGVVMSRATWEQFKAIVERVEGNACVTFDAAALVALGKSVAATLR